MRQWGLTRTLDNGASSLDSSPSAHEPSVWHAVTTYSRVKLPLKVILVGQRLDSAAYTEETLLVETYQ